MGSPRLRWRRRAGQTGPVSSAAGHLPDTGLPAHGSLPARARQCAFPATDVRPLETAPNSYKYADHGVETPQLQHGSVRQRLTPTENTVSLAGHSATPSSAKEVCTYPPELPLVFRPLLHSPSPSPLAPVCPGLDPPCRYHFHRPAGTFSLSVSPPPGSCPSGLPASDRCLTGDPHFIITHHTNIT